MDHSDHSNGLSAATVQNSGDQHVPVVSIVDDVTLDRERSHVGAELRSKTTHPRLLGQQIESVDF